MDLKNSCQCCLLRPLDKDLKKCYRILDKNEVYSDMLKECFEIQLWACEAGVEGGICEICVMRLRDACDFKRQVQRSQRQLRTHQNAVKEVQVEIEDADLKVKQEVVDLDSDIEPLDDPTPEPQYPVKCKARPLDAPHGTLRLRRTRTDPPKGKLPTRITIPSKPKPPEMTSSKSEATLVRLTKAHETNVRNLIEYSNCTPFANKTIAGIKCGYCQGNYLTLPLLREHTQTAHANDQYIGTNSHDSAKLSCKMDVTDLKCKLCEQNFDLLPSLKEHLTKKHDIKFIPEEKNYVLEFKLSDGEVMNCALCNSTFETFKMLLQHMNLHYRNFVCQECDKGFTNKCKLNVHMKTHEVGAFKCSVCPKVFPTHGKKMCHEKMIHKTRYKTKCPHCEKSFLYSYQRNKHIIEEHDTTAATYKCNICDISFLMKQLLTAHTRKVHLMERNHVCTECGQAFFQKRILDQHMVRHNGERIHKCTVCNKAYTLMKTLKEHMKIHNNDRRYKCEQCGLAFVQKCSLNGHMKSHRRSQAKMDAADYSE